MPSRPTLRFASGSPKEPYSSIWRVTADNSRGDVYISWSKKVADSMKISLHQSGAWRYAATEQSGIRFEGGDRVIARWTRPPEHAAGVTRGPGIVVPLTSVGSRTLFSEDLSSKIKWFRPPSLGEVVEFDIYFLERHVDRTPQGDAEVIGQLNLPHGRIVSVLATVRVDMPPQFFELSEQLVRQHTVIYSSLDDFAGGSLVHMRHSDDALKTPFIIDLPATAQYRRGDLTLTDPTAKGSPGHGRPLIVKNMLYRD